MSNDFILILRNFFSSVWSLFTSFRLPGLNFSMATLIFGVLSFFVAIKLIKGIFEITVNNAGNSNTSKGKQ